MLDIKLIREQPELVREALKKRQLNPSMVDEIVASDAKRRKLLVEVENLKSERNTVSKQISQTKDAKEREASITAMREVGDRITELDEKVRLVDEELNKLVAVIPNIPDADVPLGKDETDNPVIRTVGEKPAFNFTPLPHWELGPATGHP